MDKQKIIDFISVGGELAGSVVGAAVGAIAGPVGIIGGAIAGPTITKGISEIAQRFLSDREHIRIAASSIYIITDFKEKIANGYNIRDDGFFSPKQTSRSPAAELFEGILLKCRDSFEEKKIQYLSRIFESTAFNNGIPPETANQVLILAQAMSYRKYCMLSLAYKNKMGQLHPNNLSTYDYDSNPNNLNIKLHLLFQDFYELQNYGLIEKTNKTLMLGAIDVIPALMNTTNIGDVWVEIMGLDKISTNEMDFLPLLC